MTRIDPPTHPLIPAQAGIQLDISLDTRLRGYERGVGVRWLLGVLFAILLTACGQSESEAQSTSIDELLAKVKKDAAANSGKPVDEDEKARRVKEYRATLQQMTDGNKTIYCTGIKQQGGAVWCRTYPNSDVEIGGVKTKADNTGRVIVGFDRDAPATEKINVLTPNGVSTSMTLNITPRKYTISRIDGLPPSQVSTFSDKQLVHIRASSKRKKLGFASRQKTLWFKDGFTYPLKTFVKTSPFGAQRILNGEPKKPHYGVDIAAPTGTPIYAPAGGVVSLADDDLYFEGQMVLLDHGQGLISMYLHMSDIDVTPGQEVKRGQQIGAVGSTGRSTGPHLCWRLKWRNRNLDPELLTEWPHD